MSDDLETQLRAIASRGELTYLSVVPVMGLSNDDTSGLT